MNHVINVTRLHLNKPVVAFGVPLMIVGLVLVITWIIAAILQRAGMDPLDPAYAEGARTGNQGMVWSLPGFLVYLGVQAVATTFPFALALGTTRRAYVAGTAVANLIQAAYITVIMTVLLGIELATDHWFFGAYALDTLLLGSGSFGVLIPTVFIAVFVFLSVGGAFGAVWVRFGSKGPTILALALALVLVIALLILVPQFGEIIAGITRFRVALFGIAVALVALVGTWFCMRRTAVR
ncbi:hypothetical protein JD276_00605 [Leucobacter sp. CSA1]|uniref:Uncharacterized protein n=1 Tax=Leucobacter chromiisoli TaxID=2796471 RepID=A0A934Q2W8_9MICO|nr:hypothetical protein [Leucobacter chromiisoli]MBK0417540.1 hypothetical protein [Leucobacter chromiisoli]